MKKSVVVKAFALFCVFIFFGISCVSAKSEIDRCSVELTLSSELVNPTVIVYDDNSYDIFVKSPDSTSCSVMGLTSNYALTGCSVKDESNTVLGQIQWKVNSVASGWNLSLTSPLIDSCLARNFATCGDGIYASSEGCDDGNLVGGDGCSSNCQSEDVIFKISSETNAHAQAFNEIGYGVEIKYSELFGGIYDVALGDPHICDASNSNIVLKLSGSTNAHAESKVFTNYGTNICYGDLLCNYKGTCESEEVCVVTLSEDTNAHLAACDSSNPYPNKICCGSPFVETLPTIEGDAECEALQTKSECTGPLTDCTWTPPTAVNASLEGGRGGCCASQKIWTGAGCVSDLQSYGTAMCTLVFDPFNPADNDNDGIPDGLDIGNRRYCAKVTRGLSYGFWYPTNTY